MIVLSQALILAGQQLPNADYPVIGWRNVATAGTLAATSALTGYPVTNLANPATHLLWRAADVSPSDQYITITHGEIDPIDYIAIAGHNFGSGQIVVSIEGFISGVWTEIFDELLLPNDDAAILRFEPQSVTPVRLRMQPSAESPYAAVLYCGKLLEMQRGLYVGHTPLSHGRKPKVVTNKSENGKFLGRIVLGQGRESTAHFRFIDPDWYRANMDPFVAQTDENPFFFAWRPSTYPRESGFAWLTNEPMPAPDDQSHLHEVELVMQGVP